MADSKPKDIIPELKRLAWFVFLLAAFAAAAIAVPIDATVRIALFALAVFSFAIIWTKRHDATLHKELVDLVYYSAAIVLAILVFFASGSERKRTDLSASISRSSR
jgi:hypothetical protein